jgi:hypothetical protein
LGRDNLPAQSALRLYEEGGFPGSFVGFEVLTVVTMKISVFWDVIPRSSASFWRNVLPPSSWPRSKPSRKPERSKQSET